MKRYAKKRPGRRFKKLSGPTVINIHGLYIELGPEDKPLLDFIQMLTHAVKGDTEVKEDLTPEQKAIAEKKVMIESLEKAVCLEGGVITSLKYFEEPEVVRIRHEKGYSVCISAEGKNKIALLYEVWHELKPFLSGSVFKAGWEDSFGPSCDFSKSKLLYGRNH